MKHTLTELGLQMDNENPISAEIRALFPKGVIVAAAGHSLSRPCLRATELVQGVFNKVNGELHGVHFPSGEGLEKQSKDSDYAFKLDLNSDLTIVRSFVMKSVVNALIAVRPLYIGGRMDTVTVVSALKRHLPRRHSVRRRLTKCARRGGCWAWRRAYQSSAW